MHENNSKLYKYMIESYYHIFYMKTLEYIYNFLHYIVACSDFYFNNLKNLAIINE